MNRVAVVGSCGSGKSYLARELGRLLRVPVIHLDSVFYDDEWNALPSEEFEAAQRELVAAPRWVVDGNYNSSLRVRLEACDTVVMMDVSTPAALWGILSRQVRHGAGQHAQGVFNRVHWGVVRYVASYRRTMRPQVLAKINQYCVGKQVVFLTNRAQIKRWLQRVATNRYQ